MLILGALADSRARLDPFLSNDSTKMSSARSALDWLNRFLALFNLRMETLTLARREMARIDEAVNRVDFEREMYEVPKSFPNEHFREILTSVRDYQQRILSFQDSTQNEVGFDFNNGYFSSPDAEVLYAMVRSTKPARILELGCGNSTKIVRQAIRDGGFPCNHRGIDPHPRLEISKLADAVLLQKVETFDPDELASDLGPGDILFIDTSHEVIPANDVAYIYGRLFPRLRVGVLVHIHDIFLPYEYPRHWVKELGLKWGEQYIVQAMLTAGDNWEVLWPGYYLQKTLPEFPTYFPAMAGRDAQSLWIRRRN